MDLDPYIKTIIVFAILIGLALAWAIDESEKKEK